MDETDSQNLNNYVIRKIIQSDKDFQLRETMLR